MPPGQHICRLSLHVSKMWHYQTEKNHSGMEKHAKGRRSITNRAKASDTLQLRLCENTKIQELFRIVPALVLQFFPPQLWHSTQTLFTMSRPFCAQRKLQTLRVSHAMKSSYYLQNMLRLSGERSPIQRQNNSNCISHTYAVPQMFFLPRQTLHKMKYFIALKKSLNSSS